MRVAITIITHLFFITVFAQSGIRLTDGAQIKIVGSTQVVVQNQTGHVSIDESSLFNLGNGIVTLEGNWLNNGIVNSGTGTVSMNGSSSQSISNAGNSFYDLEINNPSGVYITNSTTVLNDVLFKVGDLVSGLKDTLYLSNTGRLVNESENGFLRGRVQSTSYPYFGNIGVEMSTTESLGEIKVLRSSGLLEKNETYAVQEEENLTSIDCIWSINAEKTSLEAIDYTFTWLPVNDNSLIIDRVIPWYKSPQWKPWGYSQFGFEREVHLSTKETGLFTIGGSLEKGFMTNGFTPDGDGTNDEWVIPFLINYPNATTRIFDRVGQIVFSSVGANYWDGTYGNKPAPAGAYYYIIDTNDGSPAYKGDVNIIRVD